MSNIPLHERINWVGASESAALFDCSPFTTRFELWNQKAGLLAPDNLDHDERVQAGQFLEPSIGRWAQHRWDMPIEEFHAYLTHPRVPKMGSSLDFICAGEPVEIKNVDGLRFRDGDWTSEGDEIYDAPLHYLIQLQHQMATMDPAPAGGWLVVCIGGNTLKRMRVERHAQMVQAIESEVADFWDSIAANRPPDPDYLRDAEAIGRLFGGEFETADLSHDTEAHSLALEYQEASAIEREAKNRKKAAMARLKVLGGDARTVLIDEGFTLKASYIKERTQVVNPYWRFTLTQKKQEQKSYE